MILEHFGVKLISRGLGFKLTKDEFALVNTKPSLPFYTSLAEKMLTLTSKALLIEKNGVMSIVNYV